jgi:hypothetical protein
VQIAAQLLDLAAAAFGEHADRAHTDTTSPIGQTLWATSGTGWRERSACAGKDPGWWFADVTDPIGAGIARIIYASCPVRGACASEVLYWLDHSNGLVGT